MSPEFILRPSLSEGRGAAGRGAGDEVSPEFILRPSLSVDELLDAPVVVGGVAGVYTPAFVERRTAAA